MSKLYREMQEAESHSVARSTSSTALAELVTVIGADTQTAREATAAPLLNCQNIQLPRMRLPILLAMKEESYTHSAFESYRSIRTKLTRFQVARGIRSVAISSAVPGEGKTVSALNLAISMAQLENRRVLLIDGDIRTAGLSGLMGVRDQQGLAEVLGGTAVFGDVILSTDIPRLYAVGAGEFMGVAADLFAGPKWKEFMGLCTEAFDMVFVDCPPILGLSDFELISAGCDGALIVVRARKTKRESLTEIAPQLQGTEVLGVILNGQEQKRTNYSGYYYYSRGKGTPHS
jgi:protein-tyrosine kinase